MANGHVKRQSSGKYKSNPQWATPSHTPVWITVTKKARISERWRRRAEKGTLCLAGRAVNECSHRGKQYRVLKNLKTGLPHGSTIPLSWRMKTLLWKDIYTPMLTAAEFTRGRLRKRPQCPPIYGWIKRMWHVYTKEYYSSIKRMRSWHLLQHGQS